MRQVLLAGKETQEGSTLTARVIADRPLQHGIAGFEAIEHGAEGYRSWDFERDLETYMRQRAQMRREYDSNHSVCTSTESTAGRSRTMAFQLSPASADA